MRSWRIDNLHVLDRHATIFTIHCLKDKLMSWSDKLNEKMLLDIDPTPKRPKLKRLHWCKEGLHSVNWHIFRNNCEELSFCQFCSCASNLSLCLQKFRKFLTQYLAIHLKNIWCTSYYQDVFKFYQCKICKWNIYFY